MQKKILLVDDDENIVELLARVLSDQGYLVSAYTDSKTVAVLSDLNFDILISDIMMPEMDGVTLVKNLLDRGFSGSIYFITGYSDYPREVLNKFNPKAIIFKPFDLEEVVTLIKMKN